MSSNDIAIKVDSLSKRYEIYATPRDRLKQFVLPRLQRQAGRHPRQYFKEFWALKDVSFEVKKGETVGIIGRNGSGKSTLLQLICGTLNPTSGSIQTRGRIAALLELGSGFNPEFSGRENVYMNASVLGLSNEEIDARFEDIVAFADIGQFIDQPVKTYSSGMAVRLAFAVAINVDPEILIVDEALSVGDELFQRKCFSRIEAIRASGSTILFVSHSGGTIVELCDRAVLLDAGEKLAVGQPKKIVGRYQKLLYAPEMRRDEIRSELRASTFEELQDQPQEDLNMPADANPECMQGEEPDEFFDPHLVSKSAYEFESRGVHISKPQIKDLQGRHINNLVRNRKYKYTYRVMFDRSVSCVRFGMLIKTTSGFPLGGALSVPSMSESIPFVDAGCTIVVEFSFNCYLNPNLYFLNAGVFGAIGEEETVLHRIVDAVAFRVLPIERNFCTEIIDFGFVPEVTINA
jgi:lipopolysaccharide transport system ATP-binding protein